MLDDQVEAILAAYPTLHAAWRRRGVQDQATGRRVSNHQAGILEQLDPAAPITVGELAQRLGVTPATISIQLARLVRLRLVLREPDPGDGRRVRIRLSEAGTRMRNLRSLLDPERVRAALSRLEEKEREAAIAGLRALAAAAMALPENPVSRRSTPRRTRRTPE
ncbi:MAG TPA: MarR family winged helix-turn-helix transcriptional regulator [Gemmatimonadales bacterium]|nr:MarR family winged helix-turn-helix transcriptional regulator [Gemmatimonadales bacterium]